MTPIERLLAQCLNDIEQGDSVQECLARYPERREELEPLLVAAQRVRRAASVAPSASFRQGARARMLKMIESRATPEESRAPSEREGLLDRLGLNLGLPVVVRRLSLPALATITVIVLLGMMSIGVAYASAESLPGDSLYPVKLAGERLRLALAPGDVAEARLHLRLAGERLRESARLSEMGREDKVEMLMGSYVEEVEAAGRILQSQQAQGEDVTQLSKRLLESLAQQQVVLSEVEGAVSKGTQPAVERAMSASRAAEREAMATMDEEPPASPATEPTSTPTATRTPTATPTPSETVRPSRTPAPTHTHTPTGTAEPGERLGPTDPPGRTKTPQPPGQTNTPQPPGQTNTPQPPGQTKTPQPSGRTKTPQPPGRTNTPQPPGQANTPQPPGQTNTPQPPGQTNTPQPPGQTNTPQPPGRTNTPQPPGQTNTPQPPGRTKTPQPPGQTNTPQPPGQTKTPKTS
jgi:hypothetical protein